MIFEKNMNLIMNPGKIYKNTVKQWKSLLWRSSNCSSLSVSAWQTQAKHWEQQN